MEKTPEPDDFSADILALLNGLRKKEDNTNIYTPLHVVNQMLDILPKEIWKSKTVKFLDPVCKSGIFLREITKRLICEQIKSDGKKLKGKDRLPYIQHVLKNQIFGIAISEEAGKISRRTVYASQRADSRFSLSEGLFENSVGNIRYTPCENEGIKAFYPFLEKSIREIFGEEMKFDVIIGNPPYQMKTGGAKAQATPLYNKFVLQAQDLKPHYIVMITPSRWFSGGFGLDSFRSKMLHDKRIQELHDFPNAKDCFSDVEIKGGVSYFLWNSDWQGPCKISTCTEGKKDTSTRPLLEKDCDIFIRNNEAIPILRKVLSFQEKTFDTIISCQRPFGLPTNFSDLSDAKQGDSLKVYANHKIGYLPIHYQIPKNQELINQWKLFTPKAIGSGMATDQVKPILGEPNSLCTETYVAIGPFKTKVEAENVCSYIKTRFFHFLLGLRKNTQDALARVYRFIPLQNFSKPWTDAELYKKYNLTEKEIAFIEKTIHPMEP